MVLLTSAPDKPAAASSARSSFHPPDYPPHRHRRHSQSSNYFLFSKTCLSDSLVDTTSAVTPGANLAASRLTFLPNA